MGATGRSSTTSEGADAASTAQTKSGPFELNASPLLIDGKIYAANVAGDVHVFAAEPAFKLLAHNKLAETIRATPAVADGRLYIRTNASLFCIGTRDKE